MRQKKNAFRQSTQELRKRQKKHNYLPLDEKTIKKIKKKHRCWQRYMETKDGKRYEEYANTKSS
jgi:hypothetical protein